MSYGVQMDISGAQLNDQEIETPQYCTQVGATPVANTSKTNFQPKEDELLIKSWLNISKDPIVGVGICVEIK